MTLRKRIVSDFKTGLKFFNLCAFDPETARRRVHRYGCAGAAVAPAGNVHEPDVDGSTVWPDWRARSLRPGADNPRGSSLQRARVESVGDRADQFTIACLLVRLDHVASFIVNANLSS